MLVPGHYDRKLACILEGSRWGGGGRKDEYIIKGRRYIHGDSK